MTQSTLSKHWMKIVSKDSATIPSVHPTVLTTIQQICSMKKTHKIYRDKHK